MNTFILPNLKTKEDIEKMNKKQLQSYITTVDVWHTRYAHALIQIYEDKKESIYD